MDKSRIILKFVWHLLVLFLIIISLFPGSLSGLIIYGDLHMQSDLLKDNFGISITRNHLGISIHHFLSFFFVSIFGLYVYLKTGNYKRILYALYFLSITLELLHFIVPNRSFQLPDLIANILGVLVAYFLVKIYLSFIRS